MLDIRCYPYFQFDAIFMYADLRKAQIHTKQKRTEKNKRPLHQSHEQNPRFRTRLGRAEHFFE